MKSLMVGICFIFAQTAMAQTACIPRSFAQEDVAATYEAMNEAKIAELAAVQREYAEFADQVRSKKSRDNKIELTNAFVDAAGAAYFIHMGVKLFEMRTMVSLLASDPEALFRAISFSDDPQNFKANLRNYIQGLDDTKKATLRKQLGKKYEDKIVRRFDDAKSFAKAVSDFGDKADEQGFGKTFKAKIKEHLNIPKRFKNWLDSLKELAFGEKMKKMVFTAGKKIGFASAIMIIPLGIYVNISKISEQQRLVQLTAEQDKVMKQALMLELFLNQKSFAELAATRAQLQPNRVCPPTS